MIDLHRLTAPAAIKFLTMTLQKAADSLESGFPATGVQSCKTCLMSLG